MAALVDAGVVQKADGCSMIHLALLLVAQTPPATGNPGVDALTYGVYSLLGFLGLREASYWKDRFSKRGAADAEGNVLARIAEIQRETLKELEEARRENRQTHERIEDQLAELIRRTG